MVYNQKLVHHPSAPRPQPPLPQPPLPQPTSACRPPPQVTTRADAPCSRGALLLLLALTVVPIAGAVPVFTSRADLKAAVDECLAVSSVGFCPGKQSGYAIGLWDVSAVTDMNNMFLNKYDFNQDLSKWDVSAVTDMTYMFGSAYNFNQVISAWDTSKVASMESMFYYASAFNGSGISAWDTSAVTSMKIMFSSASVFNQDISEWDVSKVTTIENMFSGAPKFNQDLSKWDVSAVTNMRGVFIDALAFSQDLSAWNVSAVLDMGNMFAGATAFNQVLCSATWLSSKTTADQTNTFYRSGASSICDYLPPAPPYLPPAPPSPPSPPSLPSPPSQPPASCVNPCQGTTCLGLASVPCSILTHMGCDCAGCCSSSPAIGMECGPGHEWSDDISRCFLVCPE